MPDPDAAPLQDIFIGRQPIYGRRLDLQAYELLYRGGDVDFASFSGGDQATSQVILNAVTELGLERVVGSHQAFVNLTRAFIVGEYPLPLPCDRVVLEVLEDIEADAEVLEGLRRLRRKGFKIALDDFVLTEESEPMLQLADIVKLEVFGLSPALIQERYRLFESFSGKLLAEKVETQEQFETCLEVGFDYFQGYFLAKPNVVRGRSVPASRLNLLRLLAELQDPAVTMDKVEEIVGRDVTLTYKLLRHINSALIGMPRQIDSVRETIMYLGLSMVRNLVCLFVLADIDDKPHDLITTAMLRAKMCEFLGVASGAGDGQPFFTAGLFSTLDAIMDLPMLAVLDSLPLTEDLHSALIGREGNLGEALRSTLAYERGEWDAVDCLGLPRAMIRTAFLDAVAWVEEADSHPSG
jgi:c-di-GMP phosphodiesterase